MFNIAFTWIELLAGAFGSTFRRANVGGARCFHPLIGRHLAQVARGSMIRRDSRIADRFCRLLRWVEAGRCRWSLLMFPVYDASVSERPLTELWRSSVLLGQSPSDPAVLSVFLPLTLFLSRSGRRMRGAREAHGVETGESERLYRPTAGPVTRREPGDFGKLSFCLNWQVVDNPRWEQDWWEVLIYLAW